MTVLAPGRRSERAAPAGVGRRRSLIAVLAAAAMWGASGIVIDAIVSDRLDVLDLAFWRLAIGGGLFALHARREGGLRLHRPTDLWPLTLLGVLVVAGSYVTFGLALEHGGVSLVNLFIATAPGFIAIGAYVWFRGRVGPRTIMLVVTAVVGLGLASWGSGAGVRVSVVSVGLGAAAAATVVVFTLGTKSLLDRYTPVTVSAFSMIIGALALVPFVNLSVPPLGASIGVVGLGVGATYLSHLLYLRGLEVLGVTTTGLLVSLEAPFALGLAAVLVGERFSPLGLAGVALVLLSSLPVLMRPVLAQRSTVGASGTTT